MAWSMIMLCLVVITTATRSCVRVAVRAESPPPVKAAYWIFSTPATTSNFSSSPSLMINASDLTHVFFASVTLDIASFALLPPPGDAATSALQSFPSIVRASNPTAKALLSISGNASTFSAMAASPASRLAFIDSSITLALNLSFDGLDLDWEYPASDSDMANLASLISEWRAACLSSNVSTNLLLTAVVKYNVTLMSGSTNPTVTQSSSINGSQTFYGRSDAAPYSNASNATASSYGRITKDPASQSNTIVSTPIFSSTGTTPATYPVQAIARNLDWINIRAFDYHGPWEPTRTGEHSSLFDASPYQTATTDYGVRQWLAAGLPQKLAVLGLAMYGRTWILQDPAQNIVGAPAVTAGPADGFYSYDEIRAFVNSSKAYCRDDAVTKAAFCYGRLCKGTPSAGSVLWVGFDNPRSIATKVRYLKAKKLRGYFLWSLSFDSNGDLSKQASLTLVQNSRGNSRF